MSRVGLVSKCLDQGDVELIWFDKEYLFFLLQAFVSVIFLLLLLLELLFCLLVASSLVTFDSGDRNIQKHVQKALKIEERYGLFLIKKVDKYAVGPINVILNE